jgi:peptidoglycan/xylan/chitin deacetylase (PgdA/CDA1 family)
MNRRTFINRLACAASLAAAGKAGALNAFSDKSAGAPQVAITMDDFSLGETPRLSLDERNRRLLEALNRRSSLKAAIFVTGRNVDNPTGRRLLKEWDDRKHIIANHSYSHLYYNSGKVSFEEFSEDLLRGEAAIKGFSQFRKFFRFPYLKEGDTVEKRDRMRAFLKEHGYRNGHVTIDTSDWYVDERMRKRLEREPAADLAPYRDFYLSHAWERAAFYDDLSRKVVGRRVKHTILTHFNLLNALFLGDLLAMFEGRGWKLIDAADAFSDPVFASAPRVVPAGESLIWALAKESGKFEDLLRYPAEDSRHEKEKMDRLGL